jgi:hypothetical protein
MTRSVFVLSTYTALTDANPTTVFRDQDISPQQQQALGLYLGDGEIERHPQAAQVPGIGGGVSLIWEAGRKDKILGGRSQRVPYGGGQFGWHTDLVHEGERFPLGKVVISHFMQPFLPAILIYIKTLYRKW